VSENINSQDRFVWSELKINEKGELVFFLFDKRLNRGFHFTIHKDGVFHVRTTYPKVSSADIEIKDVMPKLLETARAILKVLVESPPSGYSYRLSYATESIIQPQFIVNTDMSPDLEISLKKGFSKEMEVYTYPDTRNLLIDIKNLTAVNKDKVIYNFSVYIPKLRSKFIILPSTNEAAYRFFEYIDTSFDSSEWANEGFIPLKIPTKKRDLKRLCYILEKNEAIKMIMEFFESNEELDIFKKVEETFREFH